MVYHVESHDNKFHFSLGDDHHRGHERQPGIGERLNQVIQIIYRDCMILCMQEV